RDLPSQPALAKRVHQSTALRSRGALGEREGIFFMDRAQVDSRIRTLLEPFNKKGFAVAEDTTFAGDLEFDSLTVMDFVAAIEDEFDIIISMNQQAGIETYG